MLSFSFTNLPDTFTSLLQMNMNGKNISFEDVVPTLMKNPGLYKVIQNYYLDIDKAGRIPTIIKNIGWDNFRNHIAAMIIHKKKYGEYPSEFDYRLIEPILNYERVLQQYTVSGYSRSFLLGFYFVMNGKHHDFLSKNIFTILQQNNAKTIKLDWLLVTLMHFEEFFDQDELITLINSGITYEEIIEGLETKQKNIMLQSFLGYGSSIGDADMFLEKRL